MGSEPPAVSVFDSTIESVDLAEEMTLEYAQSVGLDEPDRYSIGLAFREVFINAIKHGNQFGAGKKVVIRLSNPDGAMVVEVIDQGPGFQVAEVPNPLQPENLGRRSGRGLLMAAHLVDDFQVEPHRPEGTLVRITKRVTKH